MPDFNNFRHMEVDAGYATRCHIPVTRAGRQTAPTGEGYVRIKRAVAGKNHYACAHRVRFAAAQELAPDAVLDHLCRNRRCCNPAHLEIVSVAVNVRRGECAKLNDTKVAALRAAYADGTTQTQIAKDFGLSQSHVSRLVRNLYWSSGPCLHWQQRKGGTQNL